MRTLLILKMAKFWHQNRLRYAKMLYTINCLKRNLQFITKQGLDGSKISAQYICWEIGEKLIPVKNSNNFN